MPYPDDGLLMQADLFFIFGLAAAGFFINFFMPELLKNQERSECVPKDPKDENTLEPRDPGVGLQDTLLDTIQ